jgi:hypothetical protein
MDLSAGYFYDHVCIEPIAAFIRICDGLSGTRAQSTFRKTTRIGMVMPSGDVLEQFPEGTFN